MSAYLFRTTRSTPHWLRASLLHNPLLRWCRIALGAALLLAAQAHAAMPAAIVDWVIPPAWQRIGADGILQPLQPGQPLPAGARIVTGVGGFATVRIDADRQVLLLPQSTWRSPEAASTATDDAGELLAGEVRIQERNAPLPEDARGHFRLQAGAPWSVRLLQTDERRAAQALFEDLQRAGVPAQLEAVQGGARWQVVLAGLPGLQDAGLAANSLKARFAAIVQPAIDGQFRASPVDAAMPVMVEAAGPAAEPPPAADTACIEWGSFAAADLERARAALRALTTAAIGQRQVGEAAAWLVLIPPYRSRAEAMLRLAEVQRMGLRSATLVEDDPALRNAILFGRYASQARAAQRLAQIRAAGLSAVRLQPAHAITRMVLVVAQAEAGLRARLAALQPAFADTQLSECASR